MTCKATFPPMAPVRCAREMSAIGGHSEELSLGSVLLGETRNGPGIIRLASVIPSNALIFRLYNIFAIDPFEPANGEMTPCHFLEMLDKRVVHGTAA